MHVWQMNDGRWHISLETRSRYRFANILANKEAFKLFDRGYDRERDAREAEANIRAMIGA